MHKLLLALTLAIPAVAHSQSNPDPKIHPDHTVTFELSAPSAAKVAVAIEGRKAPIPLHKNEAGLWTTTTEPLPPEYYSYHFEVDGLTELDRRNTTIKASYTATGNGFLIPGNPAMPWETTAIPHGTVHHHTYTTAIVTGLDANQSEYFVYTPPGYDPRAKTRYPVLYLLHGWSDTAAGWSAIGHANDILDTLIATGKARPMIVVMPLGYGAMSFVRQGFNVWQDPAAITENVKLFGTALLTEVLPAVERDYLVAPGRENRAIAGLSMGGLESLSIGLRHADLFAYVGGFSSAVFGSGPDHFAGIDAKKANLKLLWVACGTEDNLIEGNRKLATILKAEGFEVTPIETPGMHTWLVWRDNLVHFAPLLFTK